MRALGYVRQSRESEAGGSPAMQRQAIERYCEAQGWQLVDVLEDLGRSGYDPKVVRPGLDQLLALVDRGSVERVVVWKLDRLTRRGIREAMDLVERLRVGGAALVSVTEPFDLSTAIGEGVFGLLLSLAKAESEKTSERVRGSKDAARREGGWQGGPVPFGFKRQRDNGKSRLVLDPEREEMARLMIKHVLDGNSVRSLVQMLNGATPPVKPPRGREWSHASLLGWLRNPVLAGYLPDNRGDVLRDERGRPVKYGEALVTAAQWRKLQKRMEPQRGRRPQQQSLLGGIAVCAGCGTTMGGETGGRSPNYRCNRAVRGLDCPAPARVPMRDTDTFVVDALAYKLADAVEAYQLHGERDPFLDRVARWWTLRQQHTVDVPALRAEQADVEAALNRLREAYVAGDFEADPAQYRRLHDSYEARRRGVLQQLRALETMPPLNEVADPSFIMLLDHDQATKRELIEVAFERIECRKAGRPGIRFVPEERLVLETAIDWERALRHADGLAAWTTVRALTPWLSGTPPE